jgi:hypothetical protein
MPKPKECMDTLGAPGGPNRLEPSTPNLPLTLNGIATWCDRASEDVAAGTHVDSVARVAGQVNRGGGVRRHHRRQDQLIAVAFPADLGSAVGSGEAGAGMSEAAAGTGAHQQSAMARCSRGETGDGAVHPVSDGAARIVTALTRPRRPRQPSAPRREWVRARSRARDGERAVLSLFGGQVCEPGGERARTVIQEGGGGGEDLDVCRSSPGVRRAEGSRWAGRRSCRACSSGRCRAAGSATEQGELAVLQHLGVAEGDDVAGRALSYVCAGVFMRG